MICAAELQGMRILNEFEYYRVTCNVLVLTASNERKTPNLNVLIVFWSLVLSVFK
jgi:hypothetical protein